MLIYALQSYSSPALGSYTANQTYTVTDAIGNQLIQLGVAQNSGGPSFTAPVDVPLDQSGSPTGMVTKASTASGSAAVAAAIYGGSLSKRLKRGMDSARGHNGLELPLLTLAASAATSTDTSPCLETNGTAPTTPTTYQFFANAAAGDLTLDANAAYWRLNGAPLAGNQFLFNSGGARMLRVLGARTDATTYSNPYGAFWVSIYTNAAIVQVGQGATSVPMRVRIDGRWHARIPSLVPTWYDKLTITHGTSKWRRFDFQLASDATMLSIIIGSADKIAAAPPYPATILWVGDSVPTTPIGTSQYDSPANLLREISGCNVIAHSIGGSGFVTGNLATNAWRLDDIAAAVDSNTVIFENFGINDAGQAGVQAAAQAFYQGIRSRGVTAPIISTVYGGARNNDAAIVAVESAKAAAIAAMADRYIVQVPTVSGSDPWLTGSKTVGDTAGKVDGNAWAYVGGDGVDHVHPSGLAGSEYWARRSMDAIYTSVVAMGL